MSAVSHEFDVALRKEMAREFESGALFVVRLLRERANRMAPNCPEQLELRRAANSFAPVVGTEVQTRRMESGGPVSTKP